MEAGNTKKTPHFWNWLSAFNCHDYSYLKGYRCNKAPILNRGWFVFYQKLWHASFDCSVSGEIKVCHHKCHEKMLALCVSRNHYICVFHKCHINVLRWCHIWNLSYMHWKLNHLDPKGLYVRIQKSKLVGLYISQTLSCQLLCIVSMSCQIEPMCDICR